MGAIVFRDVQVFDGSGRAPFAGTVTVEGPYITGVGDGDNPDVVAQRDVTVADGRGATLMPGLVEALDLLEAAKDRVFVAPAAGLPYSLIHEAPTSASITM